MVDDVMDVRELMHWCMDTSDECDVFVYINDIPIGFGVCDVDYNFDGSLKIHIKDEGLRYEE